MLFSSSETCFDVSIDLGNYSWIPLISGLIPEIIQEKSIEYDFIPTNERSIWVFILPLMCSNGINFLLHGSKLSRFLSKKTLMKDV
jgi:hypothetical protein